MNIPRYPHLLVVVLSWLFILPAQAIAASEPLQTRFVRDFSSFSGSEANAQSLYTGLKHGTRITLAAPTTTTSGGSIATPVVQFDPPTRPMGNGNVFISAALAKQLLANYGITEPTPQQLQAALTSGTIQPPGRTKPVVLQGILLQRAEGMGWGSIAKNSGMRIGKVARGYKSGKTVIASSSGAPTEPANTVSTGFSAHAMSGGNAGSVSTRFTTVGGSAVSTQGHGLIRR